METGNAIVDKSMEFAIEIVKLSRKVRSHEYELASQIIRSGTSIGANINEAVYAQSKGDFISKMSIALKEASETIYWLKLLYRTGTISESEYRENESKAEELRKILVSIVKTAKSK